MAELATISSCPGLGGDGFDAVTYELATTGAFIFIDNSTMNDGAAAGHSFSGIEQFVLTDFGDALVASATVGAMVAGLDGNDPLFGGGGNDQFFGGNGLDVLVVGGGDDVLQGGADNDVLSRREGNDTITGGSWNDSLSGEAGDDILTGSEDADTLDGGDGFDIASYRTANAGVSIDLGASSSTWTGVDQDDVLSSIEHAT